MTIACQRSRLTVRIPAATTSAASASPPTRRAPFAPNNAPAMPTSPIADAGHSQSDDRHVGRDSRGEPESAAVFSDPAPLSASGTSEILPCGLSPSERATRTSRAAGSRVMLTAPREVPMSSSTAPGLSATGRRRGIRLRFWLLMIISSVWIVQPPIDLAGVGPRDDGPVRCPKCSELAIGYPDGSYICRNKHMSYIIPDADNGQVYCPRCSELAVKQADSSYMCRSKHRFYIIPS